MAVTTIGTTGAIFGMTAETGILVQTSKATTNREKNEVRNEVGEICLVAFYNALQTYNVEGVLIGSTGIATGAPGVAITLANKVDGNGVTTGGVYTDTIDVSYANTDFRKISLTATRYPLIV